MKSLNTVYQNEFQPQRPSLDTVNLWGQWSLLRCGHSDASAFAGWSDAQVTHFWKETGPIDVSVDCLGTPNPNESFWQNFTASYARAKELSKSDPSLASFQTAKIGNWSSFSDVLKDTSANNALLQRLADAFGVDRDLVRFHDHPLDARPDARPNAEPGGTTSDAFEPAS